MHKVFFVVLHYQTLEVTRDCVDSILLQSANNGCSISVIIVDNASPNQSGLLLQKIYNSDNRVRVIINQDNVGFAKGNNIGFMEAKKRDADFIVMINNDTRIEQEDFSDSLIQLYTDKHYGVLGPDIHSVYDNIHQNPVKGFEPTIKNILFRIIRAECIRIVNFLGIYNLLAKYIDKNKNFRNEYNKEIYINYSMNLLLHGSCLIFSRGFIERFNGLYDKTFMYYEEHILGYICKKYGIDMLYSPKVRIEHYRGIATKTQNKNMVEFKQRNTIHSLRQFLKIVSGKENI